MGKKGAAGVIMGDVVRSQKLRTRSNKLTPVRSFAYFVIANSLKPQLWKLHVIFGNKLKAFFLIIYVIEFNFWFVAPCLLQLFTPFVDGIDVSRKQATTLGILPGTTAPSPSSSPSPCRNIVSVTVIARCLEVFSSTS